MDLNCNDWVLLRSCLLEDQEGCCCFGTKKCGQLRTLFWVMATWGSLVAGKERIRAT